MSRKSMFLAFACLATGALFGYAAASGKLNVFQRVTGAAPPAEKEDGSCCSEATGRSHFVSAQDDKKGGKKPNIVVIMGDDIGMWNIGAYHRGMMAGRTDRAEGVLDMPGDHCIGCGHRQAGGPQRCLQTESI